MRKLRARGYHSAAQRAGSPQFAVRDLQYSSEAAARTSRSRSSSRSAPGDSRWSRWRMIPNASIVQGSSMERICITCSGSVCRSSARNRQQSGGVDRVGRRRQPSAAANKIFHKKCTIGNKRNRMGTSCCPTPRNRQSITERRYDRFPSVSSWHLLRACAVQSPVASSSSRSGRCTANSTRSTGFSAPFP